LADSIDVKALLEEVKASPYEEIAVTTPHTGIVEFVVTDPGTRAVGPSGSLGEKPGTLLAYLDREHNKKPIHAPLKGEVTDLALEYNGSFAQAGERLMTIRHYLTREEVLSVILKKALHLFRAPERAKYYFIPEVEKKINASGMRSVKVHDGMDLVIMSRMKRESVLQYSGPSGLIYQIYFKSTENVDANQPLVGVCPPDQLDLIHEVVNKVKSEWKEPA
jgi:hypothetical protein